MSRVPRVPFPFMRHRSLADVARTTDLQAAAAFRRLTNIEAFELSGLLEKAERNNPPLPPDQPA